MTAAQLLELRALADRATPGKWVTHTPGCDPYQPICGWSQHHEAEGPAGGISATGPAVWSKEQALADAAFIAAARSAVPALLDRVAELEAGLRDALAIAKRVVADTQVLAVVAGPAQAVTYSIIDTDPLITPCPQCECGVIGDDYCPNCGGDAIEVFDRSALYTLSHNIQVGAALVMAYCEGCDECGSWGPGNDDVFPGWRPNRVAELEAGLRDALAIAKRVVADTQVLPSTDSERLATLAELAR